MSERGQTQLLTIEVAARRLAISARQLRRLATQREIATIVVGKRGVRISEHALEAFCARRLRAELRPVNAGDRIALVPENGGDFGGA